LLVYVAYNRRGQTLRITEFPLKVVEEARIQPLNPIEPPRHVTSEELKNAGLKT